MTNLARAVAALGLLLVVWLLRGARGHEEAMSGPIVRTVVKHPWLAAGTMAAVAVAFGALVLISGVAPIQASSGHWRITAAFLDFAKVRSVSTHSWGVEVPPLDDEAMVVKGAGHYERACLPCHGGPGRAVPPGMRAMTPPPPQLDVRIRRWTAAELFSIVKHGIKFTGMPGWPVPHRDDEIWPMVAFLRRMPQLDLAAYRRLAFGVSEGADVPADLPRVHDRMPPLAVRRDCWRCHGVNGTGRGRGAFPTRAGQRSEYLARSLRAFRDGTRFSAAMADIAASLDAAAIHDVATYYEGLPAREAEPSGEALVGPGRTIATQGIPQRDIPACVECHGPTALPKNRAYPTLTAQHAEYLVAQLILLKERRRGGSSNVDLMHAFVSRLREDEMRQVAHFYAALPAEPDPSLRIR
jgi:cytochrome c553